MAKSFLIALLFLSMPALASDWQMTYYNNARKGSLLIDKDSIVETQGSVRKFWTLFAPSVTVGRPGEGYAYSKMLRLLSCTDRTSSVIQAIYYDVNQVPHESVVEDKAMHDIVPDSEGDYLWQYMCKPDERAKLAAPAGKISEFLNDQVKFTKENDLLVKKSNDK